MESAFRKAALLVTALDSRSADALLEQMGEEQAALVRNAVLDLDHVDPDEQAQVVAEFLGSKDSDSESAAPSVKQSHAGVELELSSAALESPPPVVLHEPINHAGIEQSNDERRFEFLLQASGSAIAALIRQEHPQTIAIVMSHLPPRHASEVLLQFDSTQQVEILRRVAQLDSADEHLIHEVEQEIEGLLAAQFRRRQSRSVGVSAVNAILAEAGEHRDYVLNELAANDHQLANQIDSPAVEIPEFPKVSHIQAKATESIAETPDEEPELPTQESRTVSFHDVMRLSDDSLARLFAESDPDAAILALAGAPKVFVDRIIKQLPRKQRKSIQKKLGAIGPLSIRDIERAQSYLAQLAAQIGEDQPELPRFAAAA